MKHVRFPILQPAAAGKTSQRLLELDGLRGWAALSVVAFHAFWETFGVVSPWIRNPATAFFLDGGLAVAIFFVLSGEALSTPYFNGGGRRAVVRLALRRYPRLTIPIFVSCLIVFLILALGGNHSSDAAELVKRSDWMGSWLRRPADFLNVIRFSTFGVYVNANSPDSLNPFLWTMRVELIGSALVFLFLVIAHRQVWGYPALVVSLILLLLGRGDFGQLACFPAGVLLAGARQSNWMVRLRRRRWMTIVAFGMAALVALADIYHPWSRKGIGQHPTGIYAIVLCASLLFNAPAARFFAGRFSQFLGRISFPLFLMQFPIIISLGSVVIVRAAFDGFSAWEVLAAGTIIVVCSVIAAMAFEPVEMLAQIMSRRISAILVGR